MDSNKTLPTELSNLVKEGTVFLFIKPTCPYCIKAKKVLQDNHIPYGQFDVANADSDFMEIINKHSGVSTVPKVYIGTTCIGGCSELLELHKNNKLFPLLENHGISHKKE